MKVYPKTSKYDQNWLSENSMGPNPLWPMEDVCEHLDSRPGIMASWHGLILQMPTQKRILHLSRLRLLKRGTRNEK
jgi:hypothetical protein